MWRLQHLATASAGIVQSDGRGRIYDPSHTGGTVGFAAGKARTCTGDNRRRRTTEEAVGPIRIAQRTKPPGQHQYSPGKRADWLCRMTRVR